MVAWLAPQPLVRCHHDACKLNDGNLYDYKFSDIHKEYQSSPQAFVIKEKERVEGFLYMYKISKVVATVTFIATLLIFWLTKSPVWQGAAIGLTLFGLSGLIVDYFSQHRAMAYYEAIFKMLD